MPSTRKLHRLKEIRERAGFTQRTISRRTGLSLLAVRKHEESNDVSLWELLLWRDAMGVPIAELFSDTPDRLAVEHSFAPA